MEKLFGSPSTFGMSVEVDETSERDWKTISLSIHFKGRSWSGGPDFLYAMDLLPVLEGEGKRHDRHFVEDIDEIEAKSALHEIFEMYKKKRPWANYIFIKGQEYHPNDFMIDYLFYDTPCVGLVEENRQEYLSIFDEESDFFVLSLGVGTVKSIHKAAASYIREFL